MTQEPTENSKTTQNIPPGQALTQKFPVVGERQPAPQALDLEHWRLVVDGQVEEPLELTYDTVLELAQEERLVDIHCVTGWSHLQTRLGGFPLARLLERVRPLPTAQFVRFEAYSARGHDTTLPLSLAAEDTWLVHRRNGQVLAPEHGFPLRTVTPSRYFFKSLKWVHRIELLAEDRLGYWERESSYHNGADPWTGDQRFTSGSLRPAQLERFRNSPKLAAYRKANRVLLGLDLQHWDPQDRDLSGLQLKNCNLQDARLAGVDLRGANLSLSDLRGADLRGANLRGADVEGVNFSGADLRDADFRDTLLSATRFFEAQANGEVREARVEGLLRAGGSGLLEDQEAFLRRFLKA